MNERIEGLLVKYREAERRLKNALEELPNSGDECQCGGENHTEFIHYGEWMEIQVICLDCGGYMEARE